MREYPRGPCKRPPPPSNRYPPRPDTRQSSPYGARRGRCPSARCRSGPPCIDPRCGPRHRPPPFVRRRPGLEAAKPPAAGKQPVSSYRLHGPFCQAIGRALAVKLSTFTRMTATDSAMAGVKANSRPVWVFIRICRASIFWTGSSSSTAVPSPMTEA